MFADLPLFIKLGLILATLLSVIIIYTEKKFSILKTIVLFIASVGLFLSLFSLADNAYKILTYPTYKATIVHVDEIEKVDDEGDTYFMYQPTYTFYDGQKEIKVKSAISTGGELEIGEEVKIAYKNGEFVEYTEGTFIFIIATLIGLSITGFTLFIIMGMAFNKNFNFTKHGLRLFRILVSLFIFMFIFGILRKFWLIYLGEEDISNMSMFVLIIVFALSLLVLNAMVKFDSLYSKDKNTLNKKKKSRKTRRKTRRKKSVKKDLNPFDSNIIALVGILFFATIFSIISLLMYSDDGINLFVVVFGLIGVGGAISSFYFYLSYLYFKTLSFELDTPIRNGKILKGSFFLKRNIQKNTIFMAVLENMHQVQTIDRERKKSHRTETIWMMEKELLYKKEAGGFYIPFSFIMKDYKRGTLQLSIKAKVRWITFIRSYTLDKK